MKEKRSRAGEGLSSEDDLKLDGDQRGVQLRVPIGTDEFGKKWALNLSQSPGVLVCGVTGSGMSMFLMCVISALTSYSPRTVRLVLIDPRAVAFTRFDSVPHLLEPLINDPIIGIGKLTALAAEASRRIANIKSDYGPNIVVIIEDLCDLMITEDRAQAEAAIECLLRDGIFVGIHLLVGMSRVDRGIMTDKIRASASDKVVFRLEDSQQSDLVLRRAGAESLKGRGDMLFLAARAAEPIHLQAPYSNLTGP